MAEEKLDTLVTKQVTEYVYQNYKGYKGKNLVVKEYDTCFKVYKHINGSPLVLSKKIL